MTGNEHVARAEAAYLEARSAHDRLDVARARGEPDDTTALEAAAADAMAAARDALEAVPAEGLDPDEAAAIATMREGLVTAASYSLPGIEGGRRRSGRDPVEYTRRVRALDAAFAATAGALTLDGRPVTRLQVLAMLAEEPDAARRRELLLALEPLWRSVDGDGGPDSPYRALIAASVERWRAGRSPIDANARALGVTADDIETWVDDRARGLAHGVRRAGACPRGTARRAMGLVVARRRGASPGQRCPPDRRAGADQRRVPRLARRGRRGARNRVRHPRARGPPARPRRVHDLRGAAAPASRWHLGPRPPDDPREPHRRRPRRARGARPRDGARDPHRGHPDAARVHGLARLGCAHRGAGRPRGGERPRPGLAAPLAPGRRRGIGRGRAARQLRRDRARCRVGAVRDPPPRDAGPRPERPVDGDHLDLARDRAPPGVVVVGDARAARRGARVHGQLRDRRGPRGRPPGGDPRGARRLARRRPGLVRVGPRARLPLRAGALLARRAARRPRPAAVRGRAARRARGSGRRAERPVPSTGCPAPLRPPRPPVRSVRRARIPLVAERRPAEAPRAHRRADRVRHRDRAHGRGGHGPRAVGGVPPGHRAAHRAPARHREHPAGHPDPARLVPARRAAGRRDGHQHRAHRDRDQRRARASCRRSPASRSSSWRCSPAS